MKPLSKTFTCTLILAMLVSTLSLAESAQAQTFKPIEPEFTVKYVDSSYTTPTTYTTDPYTGQEIAHPGDHVENKTIYVSIKNQPFTPYTDANGREIKLYYNVMWKPHFQESWHTFANYTSSQLELYPQDNENEYTMVSILSGGFIPDKGEIDFIVQPLVGYIAVDGDNPPDWNYHWMLDVGDYYYKYYFVGKEYSSSDVQTVAISDNPLDRYFTELFGVSFLVFGITIAVVVVLAAVLIAVWRTRKSNKQTTPV